MLRIGYITVALCIGALGAAQSGRAADEAAPAAAAAALPCNTVIYEMSMADGTPLLRNVNLAGQMIDVYVDTGVTDITLPQSVADRLTIAGQAMYPAMDMFGQSRDYVSGMIALDYLGTGHHGTCDVTVVPDDYGAAIIPLTLLDGSTVAFLCQRGQLAVTDNDAALAEAGFEEDTSRAMHVIPYWATCGSILVGIQVGGQYYFAQIDTGGMGTIVTEPLRTANAQLFAETNYEVEIAGYHGDAQTLPLYDMLGGVTLLGLMPSDNIELSGEVVAQPAMDTAGGPAAAGDFGSAGSPYLERVAPWPIAMTIGMNILSQYDFVFKPKQQLLLLYPAGSLEP